MRAARPTQAKPGPTYPLPTDAARHAHATRPPAPAPPGPSPPSERKRRVHGSDKSTSTTSSSSSSSSPSSSPPSASASARLEDGVHARAEGEGDLAQAPIPRGREGQRRRLSRLLRRALRRASCDARGADPCSSASERVMRARVRHTCGAGKRRGQRALRVGARAPCSLLFTPFGERSLAVQCGRRMQRRC
jgi:hypothetical protein